MSKEYLKGTSIEDIFPLKGYHMGIHVVTSISEKGDIKLAGDVTISEGENIVLTQVDHDIEIASTGGGISESLAIAYAVVLG